MNKNQKTYMHLMSMAMMAGFDVVPRRKVEINLPEPEPLTDDDIEKMKAQIASERKAKRKKRGKK